MGGAETVRLSGWLLLPDTAGVRLTRGSVVVRDNLIGEVGEGVETERPDFGGEGCVIMPGLVDAHVHVPQFYSVGCDGLELLEWLDRVIFPAEARWADVGYAGTMAADVARQLLSFGTTSVGAYATVHPAGAQAALDAFAEAGLSGCVGQVLMDQNAPAELLLPAGEAIPAAAAQRPRGAMTPAVTPRFAVSCSREMLHAAGALTAKAGWLVQTHLAETRAECEAVRRLHGETCYTGVYEAAGLLTPRTLLGHGIHLSDADLAVLHERGCVIAHCPTANRFLNAGTFDLARAERAGVGVALGSDVAGGPDRSMVRVARGMIDAAKQVGAAPPTAAACWAQITAGNAAALHLPGRGAISRANHADLLVIRPDIPFATAPDPLATLLYAWDDRWLRATLTGGIPRFPHPC